MNEPSPSQSPSVHLTGLAATRIDDLQPGQGKTAIEARTSILEPNASIRRTDAWWDNWFLGLARYVSTASRDPSTKVGSVVVDQEKRVISTGYNGLPRGVIDTPDRLSDRKIRYAMTLHAEANAVLFARGPLKNCVIYTFPFAPCSACAGIMIQVGLARCVAPTTPESLRTRWAESLDTGAAMLKEAGVVLDLLV